MRAHRREFERARDGRAMEVLVRAGPEGPAFSSTTGDVTQLGACRASCRSGAGPRIAGTTPQHCSQRCRRCRSRPAAECRARGPGTNARPGCPATSGSLRGPRHRDTSATVRSRAPRPRRARARSRPTRAGADDPRTRRATPRSGPARLFAHSQRRHDCRGHHPGSASGASSTNRLPSPEPSSSSSSTVTRQAAAPPPPRTRRLRLRVSSDGSTPRSAMAASPRSRVRRAAERSPRARAAETRTA